MSITSVTEALIWVDTLGSTYEVTAESDQETPTFYWYLDGVFLGTSTIGIRRFTIPTGSALRLSVFDSSGDSPTPGSPRWVEITWPALTAAETYAVEYSADGESYDTIAVIPDDGRPFFTYASTNLPDCATAYFRVKGIGSNQIDGYIRDLAVYIAGIPDDPEVSFDYDPETGEITIDEAH